MATDPSSSQWQQRLLGLVEQAIELPAEQRAKFLDQQAADDDRLREEAALLLSMEAEATGFLPDEVSHTDWHPKTARGSSTEGQIASDESLLGAQFGKYLLVEKLGRGGMGIAWRAEDMVLRRDVAIKLLPRDMAEHEMASHRFLREARAAARISHANAVTIYDFGRENDRLYLTMELIRGPSLEHLISHSGGLPWRLATVLIFQISSALQIAHEAGLIHRDIKPGNILLATPDGTVELPDSSDRVTAKLADFGISKSLNEKSLSLTGDSTTIGTPSFMSPEQVRGEELDARSDIYSLGATYYAMLTGHPPFVRDEALQVMFAHCDAPIPDPCQEVEGLPLECARIVSRCLAKTSAERYASATELRDALQQILEDSAIDIVDETLEAPRCEMTRKPAAIEDPTADRRRFRPAMVGVVAILAVVIAAGMLLNLPHFNGSDNHANSRGDTPEEFDGSTIAFFSPTENGYEMRLDGKIGSLALSDDESTMSWATTEGEQQNGRILLQHLDSNAPLLNHRIPIEYSTPTSMALLGDQSVCVAIRSQVLLLAPDRGNELQTKVTEILRSDDGTCYSIDVDPMHRRLAVNTHVWSDETSRLEIVELLAARESIKAENRRAIPLPTTAEIRALRFAPNGKYLAAADNDGNVLIVDPRDSKVIQTLKVAVENPNPAELGHGLEFSRDSQWLGAGGGNGVQLWKVATWERVDFPEVHGETVMAVAFTDDSRRLASGSADGIYLWNLEQAAQLGKRLDGHDATFVTFLRFTADGNSLFSAGFDNRIRWRKIRWD